MRAPEKWTVPPATSNPRRQLRISKGGVVEGSKKNPEGTKIDIDMNETKRGVTGVQEGQEKKREGY